MGLIKGNHLIPLLIKYFFHPAGCREKFVPFYSMNPPLPPINSTHTPLMQRYILACLIKRKKIYYSFFEKKIEDDEDDFFSLLHTFMLKKKFQPYCSSSVSVPPWDGFFRVSPMDGAY